MEKYYAIKCRETGKCEEKSHPENEVIDIVNTALIESDINFTCENIKDAERAIALIWNHELIEIDLENCLRLELQD